MRPVPEPFLAEATTRVTVSCRVPGTPRGRGVLGAVSLAGFDLVARVESTTITIVGRAPGRPARTETLRSAVDRLPARLPGPSEETASRAPGVALGAREPIAELFEGIGAPALTEKH